MSDSLLPSQANAQLPRKEDRAFVEAAAKQHLLNSGQIRECLEIQSKVQALGVTKPLREILMEKGYLSREQAASLQKAVAGEASPAPGLQIPGYQILAKLGAGAMGAVYRAKQLSMDRIVAIKVLPLRLARDPSFVTRFVREARAVARLNHENIITGIDVGEASGLHYFVMEYVDGETVSAVLHRETRLDERRALSITLQIAKALDHASQHGLVHRDVKPENMMLTREGTAKLCDLGLAKETASDSSLTQTGTSVGTPFYISPEQARGEHDIDVRSDLYSLGASLYHMLVGNVPFDGTTAAVVMTKHVNEPLDPPRKFRPDLTLAVDALVCRLMEKDRTQRYATSADLLDDLQQMLDGKAPKHLRPPAPRAPMTPRPAPAIRAAAAFRSRDPAGLLWMVLAAGIAVAGIALWQVGLPGSPPPKAPPPPSIVSSPVPPPVSVPLPTPVPPPSVPAAVGDGDETAPRDFDALASFAQDLRNHPERFPELRRRFETFQAAHGSTPSGAVARERMKEWNESAAAARLDQLRAQADLLVKSGDLPRAAQIYVDFPRSFAGTAASSEAARLEAELLTRYQAGYDIDHQRVEKSEAKGEFGVAIQILDGMIAHASPPQQTELNVWKSRIGKEQAAAEVASHQAAEMAYYGLKTRVLALARERKWKEAGEAVETAGRQPAFSLLLDRLEADRAGLDSAAGVEPAVQAGMRARIGQEILLTQLGKIVTVREEKGDIRFFSQGALLKPSLKAFAWADLVLFLSPVKGGAMPPETRTQLGIYGYYTGYAEAKAELSAAWAAGQALAQVYLDRLLRSDPKESEAQELFDRGVACYVAKDYPGAIESLGSLTKEYARTETVTMHRAEVDDILAKSRAAVVERPAGLPGALRRGPLTRDDLADLFHGEILQWENGRIAIQYDFRAEDQLQDWEIRQVPYPPLIRGGKEMAARTGPNGLELEGTLQLLWKGKFGPGPAGMAADVMPGKEQNIGMTLCDSGKGQFYLGMLGMNAGRQEGNVLLKYDAFAKQKQREQLGRKDDPRIQRNGGFRMGLSRDGHGHIQFTAMNSILAGSDNDDLESGGVSVVIAGSKCRLGMVQVGGLIDMDWLRDALSKGK